MRILPTLITAFLGFVAGAAFPIAAPRAETIDCKAPASVLEQVVCAVPAQRDQLAVIYQRFRQATAGLPADDAALLANTQRTWEFRVTDVCQLKTMSAAAASVCLNHEFSAWMEWLAQSRMEVGDYRFLASMNMAWDGNFYCESDRQYPQIVAPETRDQQAFNLWFSRIDYYDVCELNWVFDANHHLAIARVSDQERFGMLPRTDREVLGVTWAGHDYIVVKSTRYISLREGGAVTPPITSHAIFSLSRSRTLVSEDFVALRGVPVERSVEACSAQSTRPAIDPQTSANEPAKISRISYLPYEIEITFERGIAGSFQCWLSYEKLASVLDAAS